MFRTVITLLEQYGVPKDKWSFREKDTAIIWNDTYALFRLRECMTPEEAAQKALIAIKEHGFFQPVLKEEAVTYLDIVAEVEEILQDKGSISLRPQDAAFIYRGEVLGPMPYYQHIMEEDGQKIAVSTMLKQIEKKVGVKAPPPSRKIIFLDFETNGFQKCSVLAVAALLVELQGDKYIYCDEYVRYYYPREQFNEHATRVNQLTHGVLTERRRGHDDWYVYFDEDADFVRFIEQVDYIVAHNAKFESLFLTPVSNMSGRTWYCTMANNGDRSLTETAKQYGIKVEHAEHHNARFDAYLCFLIFKVMRQRGLIQNI